MILRSCLFTGHHATFPVQLKAVQIDEYWWAIECACGARGPRGDDQETAQYRWNDRLSADLAPPDCFEAADGLVVMCTADGCDEAARLPYTDDGQTAVSIDSLLGWTAPPPKCPRHSK